MQTVRCVAIWLALATVLGIVADTATRANPALSILLVAVFLASSLNVRRLRREDEFRLRLR